MSVTDSSSVDLTIFFLYLPVSIYTVGALANFFILTLILWKHPVPSTLTTTLLALQLSIDGTACLMGMMATLLRVY